MINLTSPMMMQWAHQEQQKEKLKARIASLKAARQPIQLYSLYKEFDIDIHSLSQKEINEFEVLVREPLS